MPLGGGFLGVLAACRVSSSRSLNSLELVRKDGID